MQQHFTNGAFYTANSPLSLAFSHKARPANSARRIVLRSSTPLRRLAD
jgi:hypothetical protein